MRTPHPVCLACLTHDRFSPDAFLFFRADRNLVEALINEILYVESLKDYDRIITARGKPLVVKQTISALEAMLPTGQFVRLHRSFIAATYRITSYTPRHVEIAGKELPIGRLYQKEGECSLGVTELARSQSGFFVTTTAFNSLSNAYRP